MTESILDEMGIVPFPDTEELDVDEQQYWPTRNANGTFREGHSIGRPPLPEGEQLTHLHVRVTPQQKQWLITHGTSETIRTLIINAMAQE